VFSSEDPRFKVNAACLMALYVVSLRGDAAFGLHLTTQLHQLLTENVSPSDAYHPLAQMQFMPFRCVYHALVSGENHGPRTQFRVFRDAGRGNSEWAMSIQASWKDVVELRQKDAH
jgi:hypothetical protein